MTNWSELRWSLGSNEVFSPARVLSERRGRVESFETVSFEFSRRVLELVVCYGSFHFWEACFFKHIHCFIRVLIAVDVRRNGVESAPKGVWSKEEDEDLFTFK